MLRRAGFGVRWWVTALAVVGLALAFGGRALAYQEAPTGTAEAESEAEALLRRAAETMAGVESFHFVLSNVREATVLTEGVEVVGAEGDVLRPTSFRAEIEASFQGIPINLQIVGIGSRIWLTNPLGGEEAFQEVQVDPDVIASFNPDTLLRAAVEAIQEPQIVDEEEIDGEPATLVDGIVDPAALLDVARERLGTPTAGEDATAAAEAAADLPDPLFVQIWIDEAGRVVRLELEGALTDAEEEDVLRRLELSAFDEPVEIEEPGS